MEVMGGPDPLIFSEDGEIFYYEDRHPHKHLPSGRIIHFSIRNDLKSQDGSLCVDTNMRLVGHLAESHIRHLVKKTDD
jgi:hypothetical protein